MAAGLALGPTLFGLLFPDAYHALFPPASLGFLNALSQVGLAIFIFLVGVRVDFGELRHQRGVAIVTSNISVLVPLLMGIALAQYLTRAMGAAARGVRPFHRNRDERHRVPVLARILMGAICWAPGWLGRNRVRRR
jgi:Kef-type K+ transport system membrane component KefB